MNFLIRILAILFRDCKPYIKQVEELETARGRLQKDYNYLYKDFHQQHGELQALKGDNRRCIAEAERLRRVIEGMGSVPPPFPPIAFEPYGHIDQNAVAWTKKAIADTGFSNLLATVQEIKVVDKVEDYVPNCPPNVLGSTDGQVIYVKDRGWMPGWDLPGSIIHETVHSWQMKEGLTTNSLAMELSAYMVQQVFEWRYCELADEPPRNLFKERFGAIGLL